MASSSTLLTQINEDFLTCRICMDTFKQPKVLSCQHSFCTACLESCNKTEHGSYMVCPVCRQRTVLGLQGIQGLKSNFVFSNMIEMMETWKNSRLMCNSPTRSIDSLDGAEDIMCATCPGSESTMATFQCLDCLDQLCADCAAFHSRTKLTKGHEVVPLEEIESGIHQKKIRSRELSRCKVHENVQMQHYCKDCGTPICKDCAVESHQSHKFILLEEAESTHKDEVVRMKSELEKGISELEDSMKEVASAKQNQEARKEEIRKDVKRRTDDIIEAIRKREKSLLDEVEEVCSANISKIESCKDGLETQLNCMDNCIQFSNYVLEDVSAIEIVKMHKQIKETVKQLHNKADEVTVRNKKVLESCTELKFEEGDIEEAIEKLGKIKRIEKSRKPSGKAIEDYDDAKNPFLPPQRPPKPFPKPSPRHSAAGPPNNTEKKSPEQPKPLKRKSKPTLGNDISGMEQLNNVSVLSKMIDENLIRSRDRAKSLVNLSELGAYQQTSPVKYEIRRQAPVPPSTQTVPKTTTEKPFSPKKGKAPRPPPKLSLPKPPPTRPPASTKPPQPVKATRLVKFGRRGKVITSGEFAGPPRCVIFSGAKKKLLVLDSENRHILVFTVEGFFKKSFKVALPEQAQLKPVAMAEVDKKSILVLYKTSVTKWSWDGAMEHIWGTEDLLDANSVAKDSQGRVIISDQERHMVFVYDQTTMQKVLQFGGFGDRAELFKSPRYICTNQDDMIIVSDHHNHSIKVFSKEGKFLFKFGERGSEDGRLRYPEAVTCLRLDNGEDGILVADEGNCRVSLFTSEGTFLSQVLAREDDKGLKNPQYISVSLDGKGQEMAVRQTNQMQIRVYRLNTVSEETL